MTHDETIPLHRLILSLSRAMDGPDPRVAHR